MEKGATAARCHKLRAVHCLVTAVVMCIARQKERDGQLLVGSLDDAKGVIDDFPGARVGVGI